MKKTRVLLTRLPMMKGASNQPVPSSWTGREPRMKPTRMVRHTEVVIPSAST